jgi:peptidoglycan hydrolase-like protein with peptidoglycan-binding domain
MRLHELLNLNEVGEDRGTDTRRDPRVQFDTLGGFSPRAGGVEIDSQLVDVMRNAAERFPLRVRAFSGVRQGSPGAHGRGQAIDVMIYDDAGNALSAYQSSATGNIYAAFYEVARQVAQDMYPDRGELGWLGGLNSRNSNGYRYGTADHMDFGWARRGAMNNYTPGEGWGSDGNWASNDPFGVTADQFLRDVSLDEYLSNLNGFVAPESTIRLMQREANAPSAGEPGRRTSDSYISLASNPLRDVTDTPFSASRPTRVANAGSMSGVATDATPAPLPTPAPAPTPVPTPTRTVDPRFNASSLSNVGTTNFNLRSGARGSNVTQLQSQLQNLGYDVGTTGADGIFGRNTAAAVRQFQQDYGLQVDGIAGDQTMSALSQLRNLPTPTAPRPIAPDDGTRGGTPPITPRQPPVNPGQTNTTPDLSAVSTPRPSSAKTVSTTPISMPSKSSTMTSADWAAKRGN